MKSLIVAVTVVVFFCVGFGFFKIQDAKGGDAQAGKPMYVTHCLSCHGDIGAGDGPIAAALPKTPANISKSLNNPFDLDRFIISNVVLKGKIDEGMPAFKGVLSKQDAKDIFAYIRSIN